MIGRGESPLVCISLSEKMNVLTWDIRTVRVLMWRTIYVEACEHYDGSGPILVRALRDLDPPSSDVENEVLTSVSRDQSNFEVGADVRELLRIVATTDLFECKEIVSLGLGQVH